MKTICLCGFVPCAQPCFAQTALTGQAAELYQKAQTAKFFADATELKPQILPTADGRSFLAVWHPPGGTSTPRHWIVSLHGTQGFATDDLALWSRHLKGRDVGLLCVQWWLGKGNSPDAYDTPEQVYDQVDLALQKLGVAPGTVMLHGFSRGSANAYAIAAIDAGRGKKYFALNVASSGAVELGYAPTRGIAAGEYGDHPLKGTRWITSAGGRDPEPERSGILGMRRTAAWLKQQGAIVLDSIEDPRRGHGALKLNPKNASRVLDVFLEEKR